MKIPRHNLAVRFTHWVTALSIFVLMFTGFGQMPVYKRYYIDQIPGMGWSSNYSVTLQLHYLAAAALIFISVYYLFYLWLSKETDVIPRRGDMRESGQIILALLGKGQEPESDKYLAEQRLAFMVTAVSTGLLIITGALKVYKNLYPGVLSPGQVFWVAQSHNLFTVILLVSIVFHLGAFLIKANRSLLPSMFTGKIDKDYIVHRHGKWWAKLEAARPARLVENSDLFATATPGNEEQSCQKAM
ncbi:MAG: cytochrome b/b6 domain-containing protein [Syntrophomonas sp.]